MSPISHIVKAFSYILLSGQCCQFIQSVGSLSGHFGSQTILSDHVIWPFCPCMLFGYVFMLCCQVMLSGHVVRPCCQAMFSGHVIHGRPCCLSYCEVKTGSLVVRSCCWVIVSGHVVTIFCQAMLHAMLSGHAFRSLCQV